MLFDAFSASEVNVAARPAHRLYFPVCLPCTMVTQMATAGASSNSPSPAAVQPAATPAGAPPAVAVGGSPSDGSSETKVDPAAQPAAQPQIANNEPPAANADSQAMDTGQHDAHVLRMINLLAAGPGWTDPNKHGRYTWNPARVVQRGQCSFVGVVLDKQKTTNNQLETFTLGDCVAVRGKDAVIAALYFKSDPHDDQRHWRCVVRLSAPDNQLALIGLQDMKRTGKQLEGKELKELEEQANKMEVDDVPTLASLTHSNSRSRKRTSESVISESHTPLAPRDHHPPASLYTPAPLTSKRRKVNECLRSEMLLSLPWVML